MSLDLVVAFVGGGLFVYVLSGGLVMNARWLARWWWRRRHPMSAFLRDRIEAEAERKWRGERWPSD